MGRPGYPEFSDEQKKWLTDKVDALVSRPDDANVHRVYDGRDLELVIFCHRDDEARFTHAVMAELEAELKKRTGVFSPVVYVDGYRPRHLDDGRF